MGHQNLTSLHAMHPSKPGFSCVISSSSKKDSTPTQKSVYKQTLLSDKMVAMTVTQQDDKCHNNLSDCNTAKMAPRQPSFKEKPKVKKRNRPLPYYRMLTSQVVDGLQTEVKAEMKQHSHRGVNSKVGMAPSSGVMKSLQSLARPPIHSFVSATADSRSGLSSCHCNSPFLPCRDSLPAPIVKAYSPISNSSQSVTKSITTCIVSRPDFSLPRPSLQGHKTISPKCSAKATPCSPTKTSCGLPKVVYGSSGASPTYSLSQTPSKDVSPLDPRLKKLTETSSHSPVSRQILLPKGVYGSSEASPTYSLPQKTPSKDVSPLDPRLKKLTQTSSHSPVTGQILLPKGVCGSSGASPTYSLSQTPSKDVLPLDPRLKKLTQTYSHSPVSGQILPSKEVYGSSGASPTYSLPQTPSKDVSPLDPRLKKLTQTSSHSQVSGQILFSEPQNYSSVITPCSLNMQTISLPEHYAKTSQLSISGTPTSPCMTTQTALKSPTFSKATTASAKPSVKASSLAILSPPTLTKAVPIPKHAVKTSLKHVPSLSILQAASPASEHPRKSLPSTPTKEATLLAFSSPRKGSPLAMPSPQTACPKVSICKDVHVSPFMKSRKPLTLCLKKSPKFTMKESMCIQVDVNGTPGLVTSPKSENEGTSSMVCSNGNLLKRESRSSNALPSSCLAKRSSDAEKWCETKTSIKNHKSKKMHVRRKSCKVVSKDVIIIDESEAYKQRKRHSTSDESENFLPFKKPCFIDLTNPKVTIDLTNVDDSPEPGEKEMKTVTPASILLHCHDLDLTPELVLSYRKTDDVCTSTETDSSSHKSSLVRKLFCEPPFDLSGIHPDKVTQTSDKKFTEEAEMFPFEDVPPVENEQSAEENKRFSCEDISSITDLPVENRVFPYENISDESFHSLLGPTEDKLHGSEITPNAMPVVQNTTNVNASLIKDFSLDLNTESEDDDSVSYPTRASNGMSRISSHDFRVLNRVVLVDCARNSTGPGKLIPSEVAKGSLGGISNERVVGCVAKSRAGSGKLQFSEFAQVSIGDVANGIVLGGMAKNHTRSGKRQSQEVARASLGGAANKGVVRDEASSRDGLVNVQEEVMTMVKDVSLIDLVYQQNGCHSISGDMLKQKQISTPELPSPGGIVGWKKTPLPEVRYLCADRGISNEMVVEDEMQLFSSTQDSVLISRLEQDTLLPSQRLCFMVEYLRMFTTRTKIPRAEILCGLWDLLWKPLLSDDLCLLPEAVDLCMLYFRDLLRMHPPGQHMLVDEQYSQFVSRLANAQSGTFSLWDHMECLIKSSAALFVQLFWTGTAGNLSLPIRRLLEDVVQPMQAWTKSMHQICRLRNLMTLLYLAGTVCSDLNTELVLRLSKLPCQTQSYLIGHVYSASLQAKLIDHLPKVKKMHEFYRSMFDSFAESVRSVHLVTSLNPASHGNCNPVSAADSMNSPATVYSAVANPVRSDINRTKSNPDPSSTRHSKVRANGTDISCSTNCSLANSSATVHRNPVRSNSTDISCSTNHSSANPSATVHRKVINPNGTDISCSTNRSSTNPSATVHRKVINPVRSNGIDISCSTNRSSTNPSATVHRKVINPVRSNSTDISCSTNRSSTNPSATVHRKVINPVRSNSTDISCSTNRSSTNPSATVHRKVINPVRSNSTDISCSTNRSLNPSATVPRKVINPVRSNSTDISCTNSSKTNLSVTMCAKVANSMRSNSVDFSCSTAVSVLSLKDAVRRDHGNISCKQQSIDKPNLNQKLKEKQVRRRTLQDMSVTTHHSSSSKSAYMNTSCRVVDTTHSTIPIPSQPTASRGEKFHKSHKPEPLVKTREKNEVPLFGLGFPDIGFNPTASNGRSTHSSNKCVDSHKSIAKCGVPRKNLPSASRLHQPILEYPYLLTGKKPSSTKDPLHQAHPHKEHKHSVSACTTPNLQLKSQCSIPKGKDKLTTTPNKTAPSSTAPTRKYQNQPPVKIGKHCSHPPRGQAKGQGTFSKKPPLQLGKHIPMGINLPESNHSYKTVCQRKAGDAVLLQSVAMVNGSKASSWPDSQFTRNCPCCNKCSQNCCCKSSDIKP